MKKMILGVSLMIASFTFANNNESVNEVLSVKSTQVAVGSCHIVITNKRTGEVVYEITLPANTAEECNQMGQNTLDAVVAGKL
jgi:hypothetical protein